MLNTGTCTNININIESNTKYRDMHRANNALNVLQDEINEIPFFEASLARELAVHIFKYLEPLELCRCSQVGQI